MTNLNKKPIGFTQEITACKEDQPKKKFSFQSVVGIAITGAILYGGYSLVSAIFHDSAERERVAHEEAQADRDARKAEKEENKKLAEKYYGDQSLKQMAREHVASNAASSIYTVIQQFNDEINSTEENKIFRSEFRIGSEALIMEVDVANAARHFGVSEENARLGIVQGSGNYKAFLDRYRNIEGNETSVLHIIDKDGKIISEVK